MFVDENLLRRQFSTYKYEELVNLAIHLTNQVEWLKEERKSVSRRNVKLEGVVKAMNNGDNFKIRQFGQSEGRQSAYDNIKEKLGLKKETSYNTMIKYLKKLVKCADDNNWGVSNRIDYDFEASKIREMLNESKNCPSQFIFEDIRKLQNLPKQLKKQEIYDIKRETARKVKNSYEKEIKELKEELKKRGKEISVLKTNNKHLNEQVLDKVTALNKVKLKNLKTQNEQLVEDLFIYSNSTEKIIHI